MRKEKGRVNDLGHGELEPMVAMVDMHGMHVCSSRDTVVEVKWVMA